MIWTKGTHQSAKFHTFDCLSKVSPNSYFDRLLLNKVCNVWPKKLQSSYVSWHWKCKIWRKTDLWFLWRMTWGIFSNFYESIRKSWNWDFDGILLSKVKNVRAYIHEWCKTWRGIDLSFQNWHEKFDELSPKHWNVSKICNLICSFWTKYIL